MAVLSYHSHPYIDQLNEYHAQLLSMADLVAHLLDRADDDSQEEWHKAGCWLMRDQIVSLAQGLPFPALDALVLDVQVEA